MRALFTAYLFIASTDPVWFRVRYGLRAALTSVLATLGCFAVARLFDVPFFTVITSIVLAFLMNIFLKEADAGARFRTLLWAGGVAFLASVLTALLHGHPLLARGYLIVGVFAGALCQAVHPRMFGMYLTWYVLTCVNLYIDPTVQSLPELSAATLAGLLAVYLSTFVVFPMSDIRTLHAVAGAAMRLSKAISHSALVRSGWLGTWQKKQLQRWLNNLILASEDAVPGVREGDKQAIRRHLYAFEQACAVAIDGRPAGERAAESSGVVQRDRIASNRYAHGATMANAASQLRTRVADAVAQRSAGPAARFDAARLQWRSAWQLSGAVLAAVVVASVFFPDRWYWAAVTAYAVSASSRTETLQKSWHRALGTIIGMIAGLVLGTLVIGHLYAVLISVILLIWLIHYFLGFHYGAAVACATVLVGTIYGAFGLPVEHTLVLRLDETAVGVGFALLSVVIFVRPVDVLARCENDVLSAMLDVLNRIGAKSGDSHPSDVLHAFRVLDRSLSKLRLARGYRLPVDLFYPSRSSREALLALTDARQALIGLAGLAAPVSVPMSAPAAMSMDHATDALAAVPVGRAAHVAEADPDAQQERAALCERAALVIKALMNAALNPAHDIFEAGSAGARWPTSNPAWQAISACLIRYGAARRRMTVESA